MLHRICLGSRFAQVKPFEFGQLSRKTKVVREPKSYMDMVIPSQDFEIVIKKTKDGWVFISDKTISK